jgi:hypothetical protein
MTEFTAPSFCDCECHTKNSVMHTFPCCKFCYLPWSKDAQQEINDMLKQHGHNDNEYGHTYEIR